VETLNFSLHRPPAVLDVNLSGRPVRRETTSGVLIPLPSHILLIVAIPFETIFDSLGLVKLPCAPLAGAKISAGALDNSTDCFGHSPSAASSPRLDLILHGRLPVQLSLQPKYFQLLWQ